MVQSVMKVTENNGIIKISGVWIYKIFNKYIRRGVNILYTISILLQYFHQKNITNY